MPERKKPATAFRVLLFAWLLAGMALWMLIVSVPPQSIVLDDPLGIDEAPGPHALQGTSLPHWPSATGGVPQIAPLPLPAALPPFLAAGDSLAGAIFRLRLVRLHPPVGPPCALLAVDDWQGESNRVASASEDSYALRIPFANRRSVSL